MQTADGSKDWRGDRIELPKDEKKVLPAPAGLVTTRWADMSDDEDAIFGMKKTFERY